MRGEMARVLASSILALGFAAAPEPAGAPAPGRIRAVWVAGSAGLSKLDTGNAESLLDLETGQGVRALAVDSRREVVWAYAGSILLGYDFAGESRFAVALALPEPAEVEAAVDPDDGTVWLGLGRRLESVSAAGQPLLSLHLPGEVRALAPAPGLLWVGTPEEVLGLDPATGDPVRTFGLGRGASLQDLALAPGGGFWVAERDRLLRFGAADEVILELPAAGLVRVAAELSGGATGAGGAWAATRKELQRWSAAGEPLVALEPFDGRGEIVALAADPLDGSAWVASAQELAHVAPSGTLLERRRLEPSFHLRDLEIYADVFSPELAFLAPAPGSVLADRSPALELQASDLGAGVDLATLAVTAGGAPLDLACEPRPDGAACLPVAHLPEGEVSLVATVRDFAGNLSAPAAVTFTIEVTPPEVPPPDPATVAPPVDPTVATDIASATAFLYQGATPIQTGVAPGALDPPRVAVLRGRVTGRDGSPLPSARVRVPDRPELGRTLSRADGAFDLAVNGGGEVVLEIDKEGYLPVQRRVPAPWGDYAWAGEVVLTALDPAVTAVAFGAPALQVARGSRMADAGGPRTATLLFPPGTTASLELPDGSHQVLPAFHVRATEYTVGPAGPAAMPGPLPGNVAYTYAVELSADEARAAGATGVAFDRPVFFYLENFLGFPVGGPVPAGIYDRARSAWMPSDDGRVVRVLAIQGGLAELDVDGGGRPAGESALAGLGITIEERRALAGLYPPGQSLWRVPVAHFSPLDCNWPYAPPDDAEAPEQPAPEVGEQAEPEPDCESGSVLDCHNQTLGEDLDLAGVPFRLHYRSDRVPGRAAAYTLKIPLSGPRVPVSLKRIELEIQVAGRRELLVFPPTPDQTTTFVWDGRDAYGRRVQGAQAATTELTYVYDGVYLSPPRLARSWARFPDAGASVGIGADSRFEARLSQEHRTSFTQVSALGVLDALGSGLAGWTLSPHHGYDPGARLLQSGDGGRVHAWAFEAVVRTVAGSDAPTDVPEGGPALRARFERPSAVAVDGAGNLYVADRDDCRVRKVSPEGAITTVAGSGSCGFAGDGGPATQARLRQPEDVAVDRQGNLYIADAGNGRIRKVDRGGRITTVAGSGCTGCDLGDEGPATAARLGLFLSGVEVDGDGNLYVLAGFRVRRVSPDGIIHTVAGTGGSAYGGDGIPARSSGMFPDDVVLDRQGTLYIADVTNHRVRKVASDGIVTTVAGTGTAGWSGDGGPATAARLQFPMALALDGAGSLYVAEGGRVRRIDPRGIITTVAGGATQGFSGDGGPALAARFESPVGLAVDPEGNLYLADRASRRVRKIAAQLPGFPGEELAVPDPAGALVHVFDRDGRHLRTRHGLTGATLFTFSYDEAGRLTGVTDGDGNRTRVERSAGGEPLAIVGLFGARTALRVEPDGYLAALTNPAGEEVSFTYTAEGLLTSMTDARGGTYRYRHDAEGRLVRAEDPAGGFKTLARAQLPDGYDVTLETALGRPRHYRVESPFGGDERRINVAPDGTRAERLVGRDGVEVALAPSGTASVATFLPDPRFAMLAPFAGHLSVSLPSGLTAVVERERSVQLDDPDDPFSLCSWQEVVTVNGRRSVRSYDAAQRTFFSVSSEGREVVSRIDEQGRIVERSVPGLEPLRLGYDERGRLASLSWGSGEEERKASFSYTPDGWFAGATDPLLQSVAFAYDTAGRPVRQTLADGRQVTFGYDPNGNLAAITPPARPAHSFTYTPVDLQEAYQIPGGSEARYTYDADRDVTRLSRPGGQAVDLGHDAAGRLSTLTLGRGTVRYSYHAATGQLATATAPDGGVLSYTHDGSPPLETRWSGAVAGAVRRTYDADLRVAARTVAGQPPVGFDYDGDGLLVQAGEMALTRDPGNGLLTATSLGQVATTHAYNGFAEPVAIEATFAGAPLFALRDTRDRLGRLVRREETIAEVTETYEYRYDRSGRISEVVKNGAVVSTHEYDANGNRLQRSRPAGSVEASYDDQDRLLRHGDVAYAYNPAGDLEEKTQNGQTVRYRYDELGNLLQVTQPDGVRIDYLIDAQNRRVGKRINGALVQGFLYQDQLRPVAELDGAGAVVAQFVHGSRAGVPDFLLKSGRTYRILADHLGSPRLVVDAATGAVAQRLDYDELGQVLFDSNPGFQPFGFAGGLYDRHTGLVRFGFRDYDPETGRWTAKDPILFRGDTTNLYQYALGDPLNFTDRDGLKVQNNCSCTIFVKPGDSDQPLPLPAGQTYPGDQDGIATPRRPGEVFKNVDGVDLVVDDDGDVDVDFNLNFSIEARDRFFGQLLTGGWKDRSWLESLQKGDKGGNPDHGWDNLFEAVEPEEPDTTRPNRPSGGAGDCVQ